MKQKINVIDLDNTLIPFDSFNKLVLSQIKRFNIKIITTALFRFFRLIDNSNFKEKILSIIEANSKLIIYEQITEIILNNIDKVIIEKVKSRSDANTLNILCSASPDGYISLVAKELGWLGNGSGYYNGKFIHMYGIDKQKFIQQTYPLDNYVYNFAISDSLSDFDLLKMFKNYELYKK